MGSGPKIIHVHQASADGVKQVCEQLIAGKVVALPTETVYGLAGNALDTSSVRQIFDIKMRPLIDPLIVHFHNLNQLSRIAYIPDQLEKIAEKFWPGPLTVILKKKEIVPDLVTAGRDSVGVRMPAHPVMRSVLQNSELLLAAPSANPFGYVSPTCAEHVVESLGTRLENVLDGGPCAIGLESTILELTDPIHPKILRLGPVSKQELEKALETSVEVSANILDSEKQQTGLVAPGTLSKHYSPKTPLTLKENGSLLALGSSKGRVATIHFQRPKSPSASDADETYWLSENGDEMEAAKNLFKLLREMDKKDFDCVIVEMAPKNPLGDTINDRLKRAAAKA